jgi:hypothetical protein
MLCFWGGKLLVEVGVVLVTGKRAQYPRPGLRKSREKVLRLMRLKNDGRVMEVGELWLKGDELAYLYSGGSTKGWREKVVGGMF